MKKKSILLLFVLFFTLEILFSQEKKGSNENNVTAPLPTVLSLRFLNGEEVLISDYETEEGFVLWNCKDYLGGEEVLFQVGYFNLKENELGTVGFLIQEKPYLDAVYWTLGTPMPGQLDEEEISKLPNGTMLSPAGIVPKAIYCSFDKEGLDYVWFWGNPDKNELFKIYISPNGTVKYYNFTDVPYGESVKPSGVYKSEKKIIKNF